MKKITITIHDGTIKTEASGYTGSACQGPMNSLVETLHGKITREEVTAEGCLPDEDQLQCADFSNQNYA